MLDNNILDLEDDELEEFDKLDEAEKEGFVKDYFDKAIDERFESEIAGLPQIVKDMIKISVNKGDLGQYISSLSKQNSNLREDMNLEDEDTQISIVKHKLQEEEYDEDYITSQLEYLKDSGRLKITASKYHDKWKKENSEKRAALAESAKANAEARKKEAIAFKKEINTFVSQTPEVKGLKLNKKDISELGDYVGNNSVNTTDGRTLTPFFRDFLEATKDKEKLVIMAKLLRNGFDFSDIQKSTTTKNSRELKDNLERQVKTQNIRSNSGSSQKRLIDLLD